MLTNVHRLWLERNTRRADFLWKWGLGILAVGFVVGIVVDASVPSWFEQQLAENPFDPESGPAKPEPTPEPEPTVWNQIDRLADQGEWLKVFWLIPRTMLEGWRHAGATTLAVLTGLSWLVFLLQTIQPKDNPKLRWTVCLLGLPLGVLSIWITRFLILWQEVSWGLERSPELVPGIQYFVFGVGLREEFAKLLCFLPLLPWIVRARDELAALIGAGCVGLGFAMQENVNYIIGSVGSSTLDRLLMPAPIHTALTGIAGLALYRACRWPKEWGGQALTVFLGAVLFHGAYDCFAALPDLADYNIGAFILFVLLQWHFFRELRELRVERRETISLSANFITCIALVAAATFIYLSAAIGWRGAMDIMFLAVLGQAMMVYLFLREMPESLVTV